jgi:hypothetical protein
MNKIFLVIAVCIAASLGVAAQTAVPAKDTTIKGATIEVIQSYKPEVKQRPKQEYTPMLPPVDNSHPVFNYVVPQQTLNYTYNSLPLRPLALGKDTIQNPFQNYVKLGGGNLSTLFLDAGIGSLKGKDYETAFHLHSISQQGNIQYQKSSLTDFEADGTLHRNDKQWHGFVDVMYNAYNYYGYDHDLYQPNSDSVKQAFTSVKVGADMQQENISNTNFSYHPAVSASIYSDKFSTTETTIALNAPFYYKIDSTLNVQISVDGTATQYKNATQSFTNDILQFDPGINYHTSSFSAHAYFSPAIGSNDVYFLPNLGATYSIPKTLFTVNAGWQATLRQNTYEQLTTENPYIFNSFVAAPFVYDPMQTRSDEVYGGIQTNLGNHLSLSGRISWWQYDHLPVFINNTGDQKQFNVIYDNNLNATSLQASLTYKVANKFAADVQGAFFTYFNGTQAKAWEEPGVRLRGTLLYRPIPAFTVTAYATILDQIYALQNTTTVELDPTLDIGGNVEYMIIPRLSVFLQVTNLLNNKNERWLGYQAYGTNIYGGIRFKF